MKKICNFILAIASCWLLSGQSVLAQESQDFAYPTGDKLKPVEVDYTTLGGLQYSVGGKFLTRYQDFENLIFPLRDYESERLLKRSESSDLNSQIVGVTGMAGLLTGIVGLLTSASDQHTPFWITAASGAVLIDVGSLFQTEAQTTKFNCVQRYNRFARGKEQILPRTPDDEKSLLNFNSDGSNNFPEDKKNESGGLKSK